MASKINVKPKIHDLKIAPDHFIGVFSGQKKAEYRLNDRGFQVNDVLLLREIYSGAYTGRSICAVITHILDIDDFHDFPDNAPFAGYVMLSIDLIPGTAKLEAR